MPICKGSVREPSQTSLPPSVISVIRSLYTNAGTSSQMQDMHKHEMEMF